MQNFICNIFSAKATRNNEELLEVQKIAQQKSIDVIVIYKDQNKYALKKLTLFDKDCCYIDAVQYGSIGFVSTKQQD